MKPPHNKLIAPLKHTVWECLFSFSNCLLLLAVLPEVDDLSCLIEQNDLVPESKQQQRKNRSCDEKKAAS